MRFGETRTHIDKHIMKLAKLLLTALSLLPSVMTVQAVGNNDDQDYEAGLRLLDLGQYMDALKSFGRSAKNGNTDAQYQIGIMFLEGEGMKANPEDAAYWFRKAAQNGHVLSQFEIGRCFLTGTGVQADERMAAEWFWRAAEQGDPDAALYVARMYRDGRGMRQDTDKARKYYNQAVAAGIPEAARELEQLPISKTLKTSKKHNSPKRR